jgi:hypothetical protein
MTCILFYIKENLVLAYIVLKLATFCIFLDLVRSVMLLLKYSKILLKSIDKRP